MIPSVTTLALACLLLLAAGYIVLGILMVFPNTKAAAREAFPILHTETLIVGTAAAAIWIGGWVLAIALISLTYRCVWEAATVSKSRHPGVTVSCKSLAGSVMVIALFTSVLPMLWVTLLILLASIVCILTYNINILKDDSNVFFLTELTLFPILPLILFTAAGLQGGYGAWLLIAFILVETFDSYALLGGKLFGKTQAFPSLSPRKTVEGLALGAIMLMLTAAIAGAVLGLPIILSAAVALLVGALAIIGDLAASALKRRSGVKDFPPVLKLQGGLLDITDAWIAAGAGLIALVTLGALG